MKTAESGRPSDCALMRMVESGGKMSRTMRLIRRLGERRPEGFGPEEGLIPIADHSDDHNLLSDFARARLEIAAGEELMRKRVGLKEVPKSSCQ